MSEQTSNAFAPQFFNGKGNSEKTDKDLGSFASESSTEKESSFPLDTLEQMRTLAYVTLVLGNKVKVFNHITQAGQENGEVSKINRVFKIDFKSMVQQDTFYKKLGTAT